MSITWLAPSPSTTFPPVESALEDGLLAAGGDLSPTRITSAYQQGIFPWFNEGDPILWWSPDPRMVLFTDKIKISRSLQKTIRNTSVEIRFNTAFAKVMQACAQPRSEENNATWIHPEMIEAYNKLHQQGIAHSVECWQDNQLVGGLYGMAIGKIFFGESMFSTASDSSKIALVALCRQLSHWDFPLIDCQVYSEHLVSLGAEEIPRDSFNRYLKKLCPTESINTTIFPPTPFNTNLV